MVKGLHKILNIKASMNNGLSFDLKESFAAKLIFWIFVANFLALMILGAKHVETPYIELGQICTFFYFAYFLLLVPTVSLF